LFTGGVFAKNTGAADRDLTPNQNQRIIFVYTNMRGIERGETHAGGIQPAYE
jgi:hypothetical protein